MGSSLDCQHNPRLLFADVTFFAAYRNGRPVGRISAQFDTRLRDDQGCLVGQCGCADVVEGLGVANQLMKSALNRLQAKGAFSMRGPFNLSINSHKHFDLISLD